MVFANMYTVGAANGLAFDCDRATVTGGGPDCGKPGCASYLVRVVSHVIWQARVSFVLVISPQQWRVLAMATGTAIPSEKPSQYVGHSGIRRSASRSSSSR